MHWEIPSTFCLLAETFLMPVPPSICFREWTFLAATFWEIKHMEQSPFAPISQSREHHIQSHPKVMWSSLGSAISTLIRNATWSSASSINSKFFAGSLHAMISSLYPFSRLSISLPFGFCWNSTRILCFQIRSKKYSTIFPFLARAAVGQCLCRTPLFMRGAGKEKNNSHQFYVANGCSICYNTWKASGVCYKMERQSKLLRKSKSFSNG